MATELSKQVLANGLSKQELRRSLLQKRALLSKPEIFSRSRAMQENLFSLPEYRSAKSVMFFASFGKEPFMHSAIEKALESKTVIIPKIFGDNLLPCQIFSIKGFCKGPYGVPEPVEENFFSPKKIDLVLVPGLAFTETGKRLGHGKGYFDRFLEKTSSFKAGACFDEFVVEQLPTLGHDVSVNAVITDKRVIVVK